MNAGRPRSTRWAPANRPCKSLGSECQEHSWQKDHLVGDSIQKDAYSSDVRKGSSHSDAGGGSEMQRSSAINPEHASGQTTLSAAQAPWMRYGPKGRSTPVAYKAKRI